MKKILAFIVSLLIFASLGTALVYAQGGVGTSDGGMGPDGGMGSSDGGMGPSSDPGVKITLDNPFGKTGGSLTGLLDNIFNGIVFPIGGILAVLAFIYSGFLYVTAQGNESKIQDAHKALLYTAIGTAVLLGARVISEVIGGTIDQLK